MILGGTGAAAAAVTALSLIAGVGHDSLEARDLRVRITEASLGPRGKDTVIRIACELENRTRKTISLYPFSDLEPALRMSLRLRLEGSTVDWGPVYRGFFCGTIRTRAHLAPGAKKTIGFEISSADMELQTDGGALMAIGDLCTSGQAILARIQARVHAVEKGVEPRFHGTEESYRALKNLQVRVDSPAVPVAIKAGN
jgi:hypothetical protein